jgi:hypothetical protein
MKQFAYLLAFVGLGLVACATGDSTPKVDSAGLVRISSKEPGDLFANPSHSMDDYDNFLLGDVNVAYSKQQEPLSELDTQRLRMSTYEIVTTQIPAAGQLAVSQPGPCTVKLEIQLTDLELPKKRDNGSATVTMLFRDSLSGDPLVRYAQHRELALGSSEGNGPELRARAQAAGVDARAGRGRYAAALPLCAAADRHRRARGSRLQGRDREGAQGRPRSARGQVIVRAATSPPPG